MRELTDLDGIDGKVECKLIDVRTLRGHRCAYVTVSGTVKGTNEDGPSEQRLDGSFYFDLESNQLDLPLAARHPHACWTRTASRSAESKGSSP